MSRAVPAAGGYSAALWEIDRRPAHHRSLARDLVTVGITAALFFTLVGGVVLYKGQSATLWKLADLDALLDVGAGADVPTPARPPQVDSPIVPANTDREGKDDRAAGPAADARALVASAANAPMAATAAPAEKADSIQLAMAELPEAAPPPPPPPPTEPEPAEPELGAEAPVLPRAETIVTEPAREAAPPPIPMPPFARAAATAPAGAAPEPPPIPSVAPVETAEPDRPRRAKLDDPSIAAPNAGASIPGPDTPQSRPTTGMDKPRKVIPSPRSYSSSPYSVAWPAGGSGVADRVPAAPSATPNPSTNLVESEPDRAPAPRRAIATSAQVPGKPETTPAPVARSPGLSAPEVPSISRPGKPADSAAQDSAPESSTPRVIAKAVGVEPGSVARGLPLTTPPPDGALESPPLVRRQPIASSRPIDEVGAGRDAPNTNAALAAAAPRLAADRTPEDQFILVPSLPKSMASSPALTKQQAPGAREARVVAPSGAKSEDAAVIAYDAESYIVLDGDSFDSIARSLYKDPSLGPALARYNRSRLASGERLSAGGKILMPPIDVLQRERPAPSRARADAGGATAGAARTAPVAVAEPSPGPVLPGGEPAAVAPDAEPATLANRTQSSANKPANAADGRVYTVQRPETLYAIARRTLGDGRRWREIYELNARVLPNEYQVPVGTALRLPAGAVLR